MSDQFFNDFLSKFKLFKSSHFDESILEDKYYFFEYIYTTFENSDFESFNICNESYPSLNARVDAYSYDEDSDVHNLYLIIYDNIQKETIISKEIFDSNYLEIINFVKLSISKKASCFGDASISADIANAISENLTRKSQDNDLNNITITIYSNYIIPDELKKDSIERINVDGIDYKILFRTYDIIDIEHQFSQLNNENIVLNCNATFNKNLPYLKIYSSNDFDVYLLAMQGDWLANLYKNDSQRLLEPNVRSYLKRTSKVNSGIAETVKYNPNEFVCYNNGISAVATNVEILNGEISKISNFQIVNGGQTTATLCDCLRDLKNNLPLIIVPVKLTVVKSGGNTSTMITNISTYSNTQTAIKKSDPPSNLPFYISLKKLSQNIVSNENGTNYICYFERTTGEYDTDLRRNNKSTFKLNNPSNKKFNKIDLAFAINCWEQYPQKASLGKQNSFTFFNDIIKKQVIEPDETYFKSAYALIILLKSISKRVKLQKLPYANNVAYYTLSMISYLTSKKLDLLSIWDSKQVSSDLINIIDQIIIKAYGVITNPKEGSVEPRMWARKDSCWNEMKKLNLVYQFKLGNGFEFFPKNDALAFIQLDSNFNSYALWNKLILWDSKYHALNNKEVNFLKMIRSRSTYLDLSKPLTKKQKDYAISIFIFSVKKGFIYNK